jgi:hypothetical protein
MKTEFEYLNVQQMETNDQLGYKTITCPKCKSDTIIKKSQKIDIPKAMGFLLFLGASFAIVLFLNALFIVRNRYKKKKLQKEIRENLEENNITIFGFVVPTKITISCEGCKYIVYENYDTGDFIVVLVFFTIILVIILITVLLFVKFRK